MTPGGVHVAVWRDPSPKFAFKLHPDGKLEYTESGYFVHPEHPAAPGIKLMFHPSHDQTWLAYRFVNG